MDKNLNVKIKSRRDTSANWTTANPVLLNGEIILVDTDGGELRVKIGDGAKTYTQLPFSDEALRTLISSKASATDIPSASTALPEENGTASAGTSNNYARADHVHPASPASGGHADTATSATTAASAETANTANSATTAGKLATPVNIGLSGAVTATATAFDGSGNITIPITGLNASMLNSGTVPTERLPENVFDDYGSASAVQSNVDAITAKIPSQASSSNQLADKAFVNSSVQTATANFRGNWDTWAAVPTDGTLYPVDYSGVKTPSANDYLVVANASGYSSSTLEGTWRFKYSGVWTTDGKNGWHPEYQVNRTPLTASQIASLNSNVTSEKVSAYDAHIADTTVHVTASEKSTWNGKYAKPTGGIPKTDLASAVQSSLALADSALQEHQDISGKVDKVNGKGLSTNDYTTTEKNKLANIAAGAEVNQNAFANVKVGSTIVAADAKQDTLELVAGNNITLTPDATNDKVTIAATNTTYSNATQSAAGLMASGDKTKLDGIATGAEVNQNAFSNIKVGSTTVAADAKQDTVELVAGNNITLTPDATNDKITISANAGGNVVTAGTVTTETLIKVIPNATPVRMPKFLYGTVITGTGYGISATITGSQIGDNYINTNTGYVYQQRSTNLWDYFYSIAGGADMISGDWSASKTYNVGDYCIYTNKLWRCLIQHSGQQPIEGTYWTQVTVGDELGKVKVVKLWENASPLSAFGAQTISLDLSAYAFIYIYSFVDNAMYIEDRTRTGLLVPNNTTQNAIFSRRVSDGNFCLRIISVSNTGVTFGSGYTASTAGNWAEVNGWAIPLAIYGIKGA